MIYFAPLSRVMCQVEFRVFNALFCEAHLINRSVPFDEYIAIVLEKSILSLIETRPVVVIVMLLLYCYSMRMKMCTMLSCLCISCLGLDYSHLRSLYCSSGYVELDGQRLLLWRPLRRRRPVLLRSEGGGALHYFRFQHLSMEEFNLLNR
jgi:hypothetical protein